mmetsp:Transcript_16042/g.30441  ORF Transcript_16042/g.30441 Transcript_16042/m.30441 type:complete len:204 (+) Transcript_16042:96-707(+)
MCAIVSMAVGLRLHMQSWLYISFTCATYFVFFLFFFFRLTNSPPPSGFLEVADFRLFFGLPASSLCSFPPSSWLKKSPSMFKPLCSSDALRFFGFFFVVTFTVLLLRFNSADKLPPGHMRTALETSPLRAGKSSASLFSPVHISDPFVSLSSASFPNTRLLAAASAVTNRSPSLAFATFSNLVASPPSPTPTIPAAVSCRTSR